jgi:hypothetical protein
LLHLGKKGSAQLKTFLHINTLSCLCIKG